MKKFTLWTSILCAITCALVFMAWAAAPGRLLAEEAESAYSRLPDFSGSFLAFFLWKNDRDFDRREPLFNEYGQSAGYAEVTFRPRIDWQAHPTVRFHYYAEIGDSVWSRTDVDARSEIARNKPVVRHKEFWADIELPCDRYALRVGFQEILDPTALVLKKNVGALTGRYRRNDHAWRIVALQIPDTTFEGFTFEENNFENDDFVLAIDGDLPLGERTAARPGLLFQWDRSDVDRDILLANGCLNLSGAFGDGHFWALDLVLQGGRGNSRSIGNRDMEILAGAVQAHAGLGLERVSVEANVVAFSPDDNDPYNGRDTAFRYSGFCGSRTFILSENALFDQFDNLDERAAASGAGLVLADLYAGACLTESLELFAVLGYGTVLEDRYANGGHTIGLEADLGLVWQPYDHTRLTTLGGTVVPGRAGGAFVNELGSLEGDDPMVYFQAALEVSF